MLEQMEAMNALNRNVNQGATIVPKNSTGTDNIDGEIN